MLAIRMQRTGRKGHAQFRVVVQEARFTPTSGRVVANIGSYDPHTKVAAVDKAKADFYLTNGAQPSERAARLLNDQGVDLPSWVKLSEQKERKIRNPEKLRSNQPVAPVEEKEIIDAEKNEAPAEDSPVKATDETAKELTEEADETPVAAEPSDETKSSEETIETEPKAKSDAK